MWLDIGFNYGMKWGYSVVCTTPQQVVGSLTAHSWYIDTWCLTGRNDRNRQKWWMKGDDFPLVDFVWMNNLNHVMLMIWVYWYPHAVVLSNPYFGLFWYIEIIWNQSYISTRSPNIKHPHENRYYTYLKPFWWRFIDEISPTAGEAATKKPGHFSLGEGAVELVVGLRCKRRLGCYWIFEHCYIHITVSKKNTLW